MWIMPGEIFVKVKIIKEIEQDDYKLRVYNIGIVTLVPPGYQKGIDITTEWAHYVQDFGRDDEKFLHEFLHRDETALYLIKKMWPDYDIRT